MILFIVCKTIVSTVCVPLESKRDAGSAYFSQV